MELKTGCHRSSLTYVRHAPNAITGVFHVVPFHDLMWRRVCHKPRVDGSFLTADGAHPIAHFVTQYGPPTTHDETSRATSFFTWEDFQDLFWAGDLCPFGVGQVRRRPGGPRYGSFLWDLNVKAISVRLCGA